MALREWRWCIFFRLIWNHIKIRILESALLRNKLLANVSNCVWLISDTEKWNDCMKQWYCTSWFMIWCWDNASYSNIQMCSIYNIMHCIAVQSIFLCWFVIFINWTAHILCLLVLYFHILVIYNLLNNWKILSLNNELKSMLITTVWA